MDADGVTEQLGVSVARQMVWSDGGAWSHKWFAYSRQVLGTVDAGGGRGDISVGGSEDTSGTQVGVASSGSRRSGDGSEEGQSESEDRDEHFGWLRVWLGLS